MKLEKCLTLENMNQNLLNIKYAVRGPIVERALQIQREIEKGISKPFERVVRANIGDCQALGQKPITFIRQVLALAACPQLMSSPDIPSDVKQRVKEILDDCTLGTVGAYSPSQGLNIVRERVAQFLCDRDGVAASPDDVYVGAGASDLVRSVLSLFVQDVDGKPSGVMLSVPQYPLFSGTLAELGLKQVDYYLDEDAQWAIQTEELERSWREASETCCVRAIVVINPGNPTGQLLSLENIEQIIKFAHRRNLFILADEVYQENLISTCKPFLSFKKVSCAMGAPYSELPLASFLSASKGWAAESGLRAGAAELRAAAGVAGALRAARALQQCSSVLGQIVLDCVVRPPAPGEPSHAQWARERGALSRALRERARDAERHFNSIPGYFCSRIDGSLYAFPRVELPARALEAAARARLEPDQFYCLRLLEETGICVVPGSGFGQREGSFHFRTTILHTPEEFHYILHSVREFHLRFLETYN